MALLRHGQTAPSNEVTVAPIDTLIAGQTVERISLAPDTDLDAIRSRLRDIKTIEVEFPGFADGRGVSIARQLRGKYGYTGELIAAGPLIPDQYAYALQCGFDAVRVDDETYKRQSAEEWRAALDAYDLTYQRGYTIANGPAQNVFEARKAKRAQSLSAQYDGLSAQAALEKAIKTDFKGDIVLSSSMGVDSSVLLHMIAQIDPDMPILFLETLKHFPETLAYRDKLIKTLGLTNVQSLTPDAGEIEAEDPAEILYRTNKDACCDLRKVRPLERVVSKYSARVTGRKRYQTPDRANMAILEQEPGKQSTLNPLAAWSAKDVTAYMRKHDLPPHPLLTEGFLSIGCAPCTTKVAPGEDPRAGRWRDEDKTECGIHFIDGKWVRTIQQPTITGDYI